MLFGDVFGLRPRPLPWDRLCLESTVGVLGPTICRLPHPELSHLVPNLDLPAVPRLLARVVDGKEGCGARGGGRFKR